MTPSTTEHAAAAAMRCPVRPSTLARLDVLTLRMNRRVIAQYAATASGARELRLYYGDREISFDEPRLFAFGETLARQSTFAAGDATGWGDGYRWDEVRPLLEQLRDYGVLVDGDADAAPSVVDPAAFAAGARPSPLAAASATTQRSWQDVEAVMGDLTGRPVEAGYLEIVVPIFRIAHCAMDRDGRQVGESNVFPPALRLDVPTRWRTCIYAGSRYQLERPMNVTALKTMRAHWGAMMAVLLRVRASYLRRFPAARDGWTVGHLERLSTSVLALPTWLLMRADGRVRDGDLHPVLSSLFRVTDGLRMTMHQMLFVPIGEPTLSPDAPMTSAEVMAYAERNYSFHSDHGVCAGPQAMIEEFLAVLIDGRAPKDGLPSTLDAAVQDAIDAIEPAMDYALLGLQVYGAVFTLWPLMTRAYEQLADLVDGLPREGSSAVEEVRARMRDHRARLRSSTYLATEAWRVDREQVYADMVAQCAFGLDGALPSRSLSSAIDDATEAPGPGSRAAMHAAVERRLGRCGAVGPIADASLRFFAQTRAVLRVALPLQERVNRLLGRADPARALTADDLDQHNRLQGNAERRVPYLLDEIEALFDVRVEIDADRLDVFELPLPGSSAQPTPVPLRAA